MPRKINNQWLVDIRPEGREGKRIRKKFDTKAEALRFETHIQSLADQGKDWQPQKKDNRKLLELINIWYSNHGQTLRDHERLLKHLKRICEALNNPTARTLTANRYLKYRSDRLAAGISPKTCNNETGYLAAVYNELYRTKAIEYDNPLKLIRPIKIKERELNYLNDEEINHLLEVLDAKCENPHTIPITYICLATGARWGEAEALSMKQIRNGAITYTDTKSGKNRTVPIDDWLYQKLVQHNKQHPELGDKLFTSARSSFWSALQHTDLNLPKGQASHVLRHTFASHFIMKGGNILTLQKILGHSTVTMTMRYAHLAPDHLQDAKKFNPLCGHFVDKKKG